MRKAEKVIGEWINQNNYGNIKEMEMVLWLDNNRDSMSTTLLTRHGIVKANPEYFQPRHIVLSVKRSPDGTWVAEQEDKKTPHGVRRGLGL